MILHYWPQPKPLKTTENREACREFAVGVLSLLPRYLILKSSDCHFRQLNLSLSPLIFSFFSLLLYLKVNGSRKKDRTTVENAASVPQSIAFCLSTFSSPAITADDVAAIWIQKACSNCCADVIPSYMNHYQKNSPCLLESSNKCNTS